MKFLIIGKNGQLGGELVSVLRKRGFDFKAYGREDLDITSVSQLKKKIDSERPDVVINASAFHVVPDCEKYPETSFEVNTIAIKNLAQICNDRKIIFVTYSTDYVFDGLKGFPYEEDDSQNPLQIYGLSKFAGEIAALNYSNKSIVIRTCGVYGGEHGSRSKKGNFILNILSQTKDKKVLEVSSEQIVNPTYALDLAKSSIELILKKPKSGIYHLASEGFCSWADFAKEIIKCKNLSTKIVPVNRKGVSGELKRPLFSALKNTRAKRLGIILPPWQNGLERYLQTLK